MIGPLINLFLKFRTSNYWYVFIVVLVIMIIAGLSRVKKKSEREYERISNFTTYIFVIVLIMMALVALTVFIIFGFSNDWIGNYMGVLFIVGPIIIGSLIIYALKKEKKR